MQLIHATGGGTGENIETFEGEKSIGGGSVSMACKALARLCHGGPLDKETYMQVTPPVVHSIVPLCMVGMDATGDKLIALLEKCGAACRNVDTKHIKAARQRRRSARTALAVLPIYDDGRRGCFFDAASNVSFSARDMVDLISSLSKGSLSPLLNRSHLSDNDAENYQADLEHMAPNFGAFIFGYPHLLPNMQGTALVQIILEARSTMINGGIVALDLNGVPDFHQNPNRELRTASDLKKDPVIGAALEHVDILHMNEDELSLLTGCVLLGTSESEEKDIYCIANAVNLFLICGVAVVIVTRGCKGSYVSCNDADRFRRSHALPASWVDRTCRVGCVELSKDAILNGNGAGDSFTAGFVVAAMLRHNGETFSSRRSNQCSEKECDAQVTYTINSSTSQRIKLTPYNLYMQENYVTLKNYLSDDKKAIFSKCHEMWENETEEVKLLFERKAIEENQKEAQKNLANKERNAKEALSIAPMTSRCLNLEAATQLASLIAAYHVDVSTRDRLHVDIGPLLDRATIITGSLEEV
jgi:sugar/nucleoside kinase (ribokinase family)